ncbi:putative disease resistance protein RGA3 [Pistacia vera]|uniref:putative disease resistance protein RGA3 n=1 Tax=Pistacia vera TaxID=55513 RepID=UPI001262BD2D|nr:putative disease resistance protein RGA3 [Pistacia vera]
MGDPVLSSIATNILETITELESKKPCFLRNLRREIKKLQGMVSMVKVALLYAETQLPQNRLEDSAMMLIAAEDMLHKLASDRPQVCNFILSFIFYRKIMWIRKRLDGMAATIMRDRDQDLPDIKCVYPRDWVVSDTFVDTCEVFGRDADKEKVINSLLKTNPYELTVTVTTIVGKGGIGKTTLAKLVYNDKRMDDHFDLKMWICVPVDFDIFFLMRRTYCFATNQNPDKLILVRDLESLLTEALSRKKFLLVLDNVVNENDDNLNYFVKLLQRSADECKLLVITHNNQIASDIGTIDSHVLEGLSHKDSMSLFVKYAFGYQANNEHQDLIEIVEKCDGIPLVVKILGVLYQCSDPGNWLPIKDNYFWREIQENNNILPMLKLCYESLPSHLQICLKHCSLFPKGFCFNSHYLIHYWMAQDFLHSGDNNEELEDIGERYLKELFLKNFFQDVVNHGYYSTFKLHDLMYDLVLKEAENDCKRVDLRVIYPKIRAQYLSFHGIEDGDTEFSYIEPSLLAIIMKSSPFQPVTQSFVNRWTSKFKQIRLLCLSGLQFEVLPDSVGSLEQLRYLDLSWNLNMMELSEAICKLKSLQTLILLGCSRLKKFPENMRKLINLRYLEITTKVRHQLENELEYLHSLQFLHLYSCHHLLDLSGKMQGLINLRTFILQGCDNMFFLPDDITYLERLEKLVIHSCSNLNLTMDLQEEDRRLNLKVFMIYELHQTIDLPQLILQKSANTLEYMRIDSCSSLTTLPPWLTDLTSLQKLEIVSCSELSSLPCGMEKLTALKELKIQKSPTLSESCRRNWSNIDHVQNIHLDPEIASSSRSMSNSMCIVSATWISEV